MLRSKRFLISIMLLLWAVGGQAKPRKTKFERERAALLRRIQNIQRVLAQNVREKKVSIGQLAAINRQIEANARLIQNISQEVRSLNQEIQQKQRAIDTLKQELVQLKKEYAAMVYVGTKTLQDIHTLMFIFAAPSFQMLVQRLRCVKHYTHMRQQHFQEIDKVVRALQTQQVTATQRKKAQSTLLLTRRQEKANLTQLQLQQTHMISALEQQHTRLTRELQQRNKAVQRLDKLIIDTVQRDLAQQKETVLKPTPALPHTPSITPKQAKKLTEKFRKRYRKLPWPVSNGFISGKFGVSPHPVLRNVKVENLGIDIQTQAGTQARAIFEGEVKTIAFVPGMNRVVILQHGDYHSVYARLKDTTVKVGQYVQAGDPLGTIYTDKNGVTELQLQLWKRTQKLNPTTWLKKK